MRDAFCIVFFMHLRIEERRVVDESRKKHAGQNKAL